MTKYFNVTKSKKYKLSYDLYILNELIIIKITFFFLLTMNNFKRESKLKKFWTRQNFTCPAESLGVIHL